MTKTTIIVTLRVEGFHKWSGCDIEDVSFLRERHRHMFSITAKKIVSDDDREIEIILFKRKVAKVLSEAFGTPCEFGEMSCESIARFLYEILGLSSCAVLEDGENGAMIETE